MFGLPKKKISPKGIKALVSKKARPQLLPPLQRSAKTLRASPTQSFKGGYAPVSPPRSVPLGRAQVSQFGKQLPSVKHPSMRSEHMIADPVRGGSLMYVDAPPRYKATALGKVTGSKGGGPGGAKPKALGAAAMSAEAKALLNEYKTLERKMFDGPASADPFNHPEGSAKRKALEAADKAMEKRSLELDRKLRKLGVDMDKHSGI